jgi:hypothetical protein
MPGRPSGKFKVVRGGILLPPGTCVACGFSGSDEFVDFDVSLEWYGAVYLCKSCVREAGSVFDLISAADEAILRGQIEQQVVLIGELQQALADKDKLNDNYRGVIDDLRASNLSIINGSPVSDAEADSESLAAVEPGSLSDTIIPDTSSDDARADVPSDAPTSDPDDTDDIESAIERASAALVGATGVVGEPAFSERAPGGNHAGRLFGES